MPWPSGLSLLFSNSTPLLLVGCNRDNRWLNRKLKDVSLTRIIVLSIFLTLLTIGLLFHRSVLDVSILTAQPQLGGNYAYGDPVFKTRVEDVKDTPAVDGIGGEPNGEVVRSRTASTPNDAPAAGSEGYRLRDVGNAQRDAEKKREEEEDDDEDIYDEEEEMDMDEVAMKKWIKAEEKIERERREQEVKEQKNKRAHPSDSNSPSSTTTTTAATSTSASVDNAGELPPLPRGSRGTADRPKQAAIKAAIEHAWSGYKRQCFGEDELKPISGECMNWVHQGLTLIDSLDTLWIVGMKDEFNEAVRWVTTNLEVEKDKKVSFFETIIRVTGGLLTAYEFSGDRALLEKCRHLQDRLNYAFNTPAKWVPYAEVNLKT